MSWTQARLLRTGPGHALATEIADSPLHAHLLVTGALGMLIRWEEPEEEGFAPEEMQQLLDDYLRGMAAAAIVADTATNSKEFTGAEDFAVGGREGPLLDGGAITLGLVSQAASAAFAGKWVTDHLAAYTTPTVLEDHRVQVRAVRAALATAAQRLLGRSEG